MNYLWYKNWLINLLIMKFNLLLRSIKMYLFESAHDANDFLENITAY
jgi:hypothetical protein